MKLTVNYLQHLILKIKSGKKNISGIFILAILLFTTQLSYAEPDYVKFKQSDELFPLVSKQSAVSIVIDADAMAGVQRAVDNLVVDIEKVSAKKPELFKGKVPKEENILLIGTLGSSKYIDDLVNQNKLDVSPIKDQWEAFSILTVDQPFPGVQKALVIVGSDKRGTIYGIYDMAEKIGVSPWYWWADVPVKKQEVIYIHPGRFNDAPKVTYRGIFLNDEAPALTGWSSEKFGGFNHKFYEHVFELILRLKGNFIWPAMWGSAFYADDEMNPQLADEMGVVIGTSHHEPLMRAHAEWGKYEGGAWNYETNSENLQKFWRESVQERKDFEAVVTVGMRGDGDEAMTEGTAIALLEKIINDQREILKEETGKDPKDIPQAWALYKEVQDYYDEGMEVADDITLLLCDDNWGNVRRLPVPGTPERNGGYGMYYHYDFVGGPVSYRWLNVSPISRTWEQMHLTWEHGVDKIWIVNVGDLKPMEFPIDFFLEYAWDPDRFPASRLPKYTIEWATEQFGPEYAREIAHLLTEYTRFNYRRTPEMLRPETYSLLNYREAERVVEEYNTLYRKAKDIEARMPKEYSDAYYQLVTHQIEACANLNEMYLTVAKNHLYAEQDRASTNAMALKTEELFANDEAITNYYHNELAGGKWNHFMSQPHIGYTSWNSPPENIMPKTKEITIPAKAKMGVAIEGSTDWWPKSGNDATLPVFDAFNPVKRYIEVYNRGTEPFEFSVSANEKWVRVNKESGTVSEQERIWVDIDWDAIPEGKSEAGITIKGQKKEEVTVNLIALKNAPPPEGFIGFVEANGYVSIEAGNFSDKTETEEIEWQIIPDFGRTKSGVTAFPTTHAEIVPGGDSPKLEYDAYLYTTGKVKVHLYVAPSLNIYNGEGMKVATSFNEGEPAIYRIHEFDTIPDWKYPEYWNVSVTDNTRVLTTEHTIETAGAQTLNVWMVTPGVVIEKIVIETQEIGDSYLGPPQSMLVE